MVPAGILALGLSSRALVGHDRGHMPSTVPFWIALSVTVLLIGMSLVTGFRRKRKAHLWLGPLTIVAMTIAILLTDELAIHLVFAYAGGLLAIPVAITGIWLWRSEKARVWHRVLVFVWLASVLTATGTGLWMFAHGTLKTA
jgi:hypothetical protein